MKRYSFIDDCIRDFLRDDNGEVIIIEVENFDEAETWLLDHGEDYGWTNSGVKYHEWGEK